MMKNILYSYNDDDDDFISAHSTAMFNFFNFQSTALYLTFIPNLQNKIVGDLRDPLWPNLMASSLTLWASQDLLLLLLPPLVQVLVLLSSCPCLLSVQIPLKCQHLCPVSLGVRLPLRISTAEKGPRDTCQALFSSWAPVLQLGWSCGKGRVRSGFEGWKNSDKELEEGKEL